MTFYEAALRVLEGEGRPLHFLEITEKSIAQNLLSHIGKTPEQTMLSRLAAMARRTRDRRVLVTAKDTFALVDWGIPEDAEALAQTGLPEPNPEEDLPPLRPPERHPEPHPEHVRVAGRSGPPERERKRRDDDEGRRRRRYPPIPEVVFEILSDSGEPLPPEEVAARAKERELASDELGIEQILTALLEDNQRRIDAGRRPQFLFDKESGKVSLERAGAPSEAPPLELQAAFAAALGIPLEDGRPVLPRASQQSAAEAASIEAALSAAKQAVKDYRRAVAKAFRRRLADLDGGTFEKAVVKMLHGHGFKELKVAKRSKEGPLLTARRREGSVELRYAVRMAKGAPAVERRDVKELRRDLQHYAAQVGLLCTPGEVRQDARGEAQASGALVLLWCGDALAEKFFEAEAGVKATRIELYDVDESFFEAARLDAEEAARRRQERQRERQPRRGEEARPEAARGEGTEGEAQVEPGEAERGAEQAPAEQAAAALEPPGPEGAEGEEEEEGADDEELEAASAYVGGASEGAASGEPGQGPRKRRRRRRRGRRRGRPEGQPGQPGQPSQPAPEAEQAAAPEPVPEAPPASPPPPPGGAGEGPASS